MSTARSREIETPTVIDYNSAEIVLRLATSADAEAAIAHVDSWTNSLQGLGVRISTGPVVPFRATQLIARVGDVPTSHVPLLWMSHVQSMRTTWPLDNHKPEYIARCGAGALIVSNKNYVLIRRFSAKEQTRRLTAAPYLAAEFAVPEVGIENHLNYIHRPGGTLSEDEAWGLAALFNSRLLDTYFRTVNGNTQVSATELRAMPLPERNVIVGLGQRVKCLADPTIGLDKLAMELANGPRAAETRVG